MDESVQLQERIARLSEQVTAADRLVLELERQLKRERALEAVADHLAAQAEKQAPEPIDCEFPGADPEPGPGPFVLSPEERGWLDAAGRSDPVPKQGTACLADALRRALRTIGPTEREKDLERELQRVNATIVEDMLRFETLEAELREARAGLEELRKRTSEPDAPEGRCKVCGIRAKPLLFGTCGPECLQACQAQPSEPEGDRLSAEHEIGCEDWYQIPEFPGYEITPDAQVRSRRPRNGIGALTEEPRHIWPRVNRGGYLQFTLCRDGELVTRTAHRLVLETFVGPRPDGLECRHLNGNRMDNRWPENICWDEHQVNMDDRQTHGTVPRGEQVNGCILTEEKVRYVLSSEASGAHLARELGVSASAISLIRKRKNWRHVKVPDRQPAPKPAPTDTIEAATDFILNQVAGTQVYDSVKERLDSLAAALRAKESGNG